jgi:hypothetical protein
LNKYDDSSAKEDNPNNNSDELENKLKKFIFCIVIDKYFLNKWRE